VNAPDSIARFDASVNDAVDKIRNPALDKFMYRLSSLADHSLLWHVAGVVRGIRHDDPEGAARFAGALGVESALTNGPIKMIFERVRPLPFEDVEFRYGLRRPITSSFPSGHATAAFCAASLMGGGPAWYGAAAVVASTRVYVRLHYASDVIAGAALGTLLGLALRPLVRWRE
jgi:undecaprenyl-diphosphatase